MGLLNVDRAVSVRIPTLEGEFWLRYYSDNRNGEEHLALVNGDVAGVRDVLVRLHSECFTGDVLGSLRCDCGDQLSLSMQEISREGTGVLLYLRQEGRGIGLWDKLRTYNLQDEGYDTVDANLELGHQADERDYEIAALILQDLGVASVRLLTNNPSKIDGLRKSGVEVAARQPLHARVTTENINYLITKATRMGHLLELGAEPALEPATSDGGQHAPEDFPARRQVMGRPFVTLSYAQSLDGSISRTPGERMVLSGPESSVMTHRLRASHDAILVGIGTVLSDNPRLTVRLSEGSDPQPVVLDSTLRFPIESDMLRRSKLAPWIATTDRASVERRQELEGLGARVLSLASTDTGRVDLPSLLKRLGSMGADSVMVEGGSRVITNFLRDRLVDHIVLTVAPVMVGGMRALGELESPQKLVPRLRNAHYRRMGSDLVVSGEPDWSED